MKKWTVFFVILTIILSTKISHAEFFNQRNHLLGSRAAMLGGAYTAMSEDISGTYYNPAGIAFIKSFSLSMSANAYSYKKQSRKDEVGWDMKVDTVDFLPTTFGFNLTFDPVTIAFSIYQTDNYIFSSIDASGNNVDKFEVDMKSYLMGPSVAWRILDSLSIGVSVFYRYYRGKVSLFLGSLGDSVMQSDYTYGGIIINTGIKYNITDNIKVGFSYQNESLFVNGKNTYFYTEEGNTTNEISGSVRGEMRSPHRIAVGLAYEQKKNFVVAFDFIYYLKIDYSQPHEMMSLTSDDTRYLEDAHYDISVGGEYFLSDTFSLRAGFFTNTSSAPVEKKAERVNIYGGTFGLGYYTNNVSSGVGFSLSYGKTDWQTGTENPSAAKITKLAVALTVGGSMQF
ncbi:OmpP1/FadL family transporter [Spirochaetota bacterium]